MIKASFQADFSSFRDAVEKAQVQLRSFETGAGNVGKSLGRMTDNFSGRKLIQDATLMEKAIQNIGGMSKLTASELHTVGAKAAEAAAKMKALGVDVPPGLQKIADTAKVAGTSTESMGISFGKLVTSMVTAQAVIGGVKTAFSEVAGFLGDTITAAADAEKAHAQLTAALRAQGTAIPSVITAFQGYASALEHTTTFQDDALEGAAALLVQIGNVMPRDMQKALTATTELASGLNVDLATAATMVAKAAEGTTAGLKKLGVETTDAQGKALDFGKVLDSITEKFGGQAAAIAGTYEGRLKQLGNTWNNVEESIGRVITQNETLLDTFAAINRAITDNTGELSSNQAATNFVSDAVILLVRGVSLGGQAMGAFTDMLSQTVVELTLFERFVLASARSSLLFAKAVSFTDPIVQALADVALVKVAQRGQELEQALLKAGGTTANAGKVFQHLSDTAGTLADGLEKTRGQTVKLKDVTDGSTDAWDRHTVALKNGADASAEAAKQLREEAAAWEFLQKKQDAAMTSAQDALQRGTAGQTNWIKQWMAARFLAEQTAGLVRLDSKDLIKTQDLIVREMGRTFTSIEMLHGPTVTWKNDLDALAGSLTTLAQVAGDSFGGIVKDVANVVVSLNMATKSVEQWQKAETKSQKGVAAVGMATAFVQATGQGSTASRVAGGATTGAEIGSLFGPIGTGVGAVLGGLTGLLRGLAGVSKAVKEARAEQDKLLASLRALGITGSSSFDVLSSAVAKFAQITGKDGEQARQTLEALMDTDHPGRFRAAMEEVGKTLQHLDDITKQYALTWKDLADPGARTSGFVDELQGLTDDFNTLQRAGYSTTAILKAMGPDFTKTLKAAKDSGVLDHFIDDLVRTGRIAKDTGDKLKGMAGTVDYKELTDRAGKYGITLAQLGPTFQQANISDTAQTYLQDFNDLIDAGGEINGVMIGMSDEMSKLVNDAIKTGSSMPEAMRPMVETFFNAGQLVDDNGKKLKDLSGVKFKDSPLEKGLKDLNQTILDLIETLGGVPGRLRDIANTTVPPIEIPVHVNAPDVPRGWDGGNTASMGGLVTPHGIQHFAGGGTVLPWRPRGTDTVPAMLTPGETVRTAKQEAALSDAKQPVVIQLHMDGRQITQVMIENVLKDTGGIRRVIKRVAS